jgi:putative addiction module CopG family antidote
MRKTMTMNVRVSGRLGDFVASRIGADGAYENVSEYIRDLIRRDKANAEEQAFARLKAELQRAFAAPEESYRELDVEAVIERGRRHSAA